MGIKLQEYLGVSWPHCIFGNAGHALWVGSTYCKDAFARPSSFGITAEVFVPVMKSGAFVPPATIFVTNDAEISLFACARATECMDIRSVKVLAHLQGRLRSSFRKVHRGQGNRSGAGIVGSHATWVLESGSSPLSIEQSINSSLVLILNKNWQTSLMCCGKLTANFTIWDYWLICKESWFPVSPLDI